MLMLFFFTIDRAQFSPMAYQVVQFLKKIARLIYYSQFKRITDRQTDGKPTSCLETNAFAGAPSRSANNLASLQCRPAAQPCILGELGLY